MATRPQGQALARRAAEDHDAEAGPANEADRPVLAVLEDCAGGAVLIECSAALARALGRELAVVQVQSTLALQAAALPQTRVLAHAGAPWAPFAPQDVERGWRAQTARLRALAGPIATRHALPWSLRTVRGEIGAVARGLLDETDLLFLGAMVWHTRAMARAAAAPAVLAVLNDGSAAARRGLQLAARMASGMTSGLASGSASGSPSSSPSSVATSPPGAWRVRELPATDGPALDALLRQPPPLDALLMPRALATPERWARLSCLGCPVLLIG